DPREPSRLDAPSAHRPRAGERQGRRHSSLRRSPRHAPRRARDGERRPSADDQRLRHDEPREGPRSVCAPPHGGSPHDPNQPARAESEPRLQHQESTAMQGEPILKKTLVTMAAMVGANVLFVGTLSLGAVLITSHAVNPGGSSSSSKSDTVVPAEKI